MRASPMVKNKHYGVITKLLVTSVVALWVIDVLVHLHLVENLLLSNSRLGSLRDYAGLLLADFQVAVVITFAACVGALLVRVVRRSQNYTSEAVCLLSSAVAGMTVIAVTKVAWGVAAGLLVWLGLRVHLSKRADVNWGFPGILLYVLSPSLLVGLVRRSLKAAGDEAWVSLGLAGFVAILLLWAVLLSRRGHRAELREILSWLPAAATLALVSLSLVGGGHTESGFSKSDSGRPHIVLIVLDTVRADHLAAYGYSRVTMPALDQWSQKNALLVRRAVSPAGWTAPAHASIFSGKTVSQHGIHYGSGAVFQSAAFDGIAWLPEILAQNGYRNYAVSANPFGVPSDVAGFTRVLSPERAVWGRTIGAFVDRYLPFSTGLSQRLRWRMPYVDAQGITDLVMSAVPWQPGPEGPIFLFVNFLDAHSPYNPPNQALELLGLQTSGLINRYLSHRELTKRWDSLPPGKSEELMALYDGELRWLDLHLERLLQWIDRHLGQESVVIITSDHGEELGEQGRVGHEYGLSQALVHVPLVIRSSEIEPGEFDEVVDLRRLYRFVEMLSRGERPGLDVLAPPGESSVVSERYPSGPNEEYLGEEYARPWLSLIQGGYKALGPSEQGIEFFDVASAGFGREIPTTNHDLAEALRKKMDHYWKEYRDRRGEEFQKLSGEEVERLRSLGYAQ